MGSLSPDRPRPGLTRGDRPDCHPCGIFAKFRDIEVERSLTMMQWGVLSRRNRGYVGAMTFWIVGGLGLIACIAFIAAALRARPERRDAPDVAVYRDQLAELDRDAARGTLPAEEAEAARTEVARRLLAADGTAARSTRRGNLAVGALLVAVPVAGISVATYLAIGAPGYGDMPLQARIERIEEARALRPRQDAAEAEVPDRIDSSRPDILEMAEQLRGVLAGRPDDLRGWQIAVRTFAGLNDMEAAWRAQNRVIALQGGESGAEGFALLAELMVQAAGGYVSPEAEQALAEALRRDPSNGTARYYAGLMYAQGGRPDLAWRLWRRLIADSPEGAPWLEPIYASIEEISVAAGEPTPVEDLPRPRGPSAEDIEASRDMTPEQRVEMIEGMVQGLAARLADDGGPPSEWARLISAYGVLGRSEAAAAIYAEAKTAFAGDRSALDTLGRAAEQAGLAR